MRTTQIIGVATVLATLLALLLALKLPETDRELANWFIRAIALGYTSMIVSYAILKGGLD